MAQHKNTRRKRKQFPRAETIAADNGLLFLVVSTNGSVLACNSEAAAALDMSVDALSHLTLWDIADSESAQRFFHSARDLMASGGRVVMRMQLRTAQRQPLYLTTLVSASAATDGTEGIRIIGFSDAENFEHVSRLEYATQMLTGFADACTEAMWCIEYTAPVDLAADREEIVRQIFENECHFSMCNRAMARLYNLPEGLNFNDQRVASYFRRTLANEAYVRQLVESNFHIDSASSVDLRHDGTVAYTENSVRCRIEDGKMLRMWGTVRDITDFKKVQNQLAQREREAREVLSAMPDSVLVVDQSQHVIALNPAFETEFGWSADGVLGRDVEAFITFDARWESAGRRWVARDAQRCKAKVTRSDGRVVACEISIAPFPDDDFHRFVLCVRTIAPDFAYGTPIELDRHLHAKSLAKRR